MSTFSLRFNTTQFDHAITQLGSELGRRAIARALNRSGGSTRTVMVRGMAEDLGLKVGKVRDQVSLTEAKPVEGKLAVRISVSGKRIPLIDFKARQTRRGVTAKLPTGKGKYPHAFIATMPSGHRGVFQRVPGGTRRGPKPNRSQLPIYQLFGPSLPNVFTKHLPEGITRGEESLRKNLAHEISYALKQLAV